MDSSTAQPKVVENVGLGTDGKFRVDNSMLQSWFDCSTKCWLRYLQGRTAAGEVAALELGHAAHAARADYFKGCTAADAMKTFDHLYQPWASQHVAADDKRGWQNAHDIFQEYLRAHPWTKSSDGVYRGLPYQHDDPAYVEIAFELPLDEAEGLWFVGRFDGLPRYQKGRVVDEFKSTGSINSGWKAQWKMNSQPTGYLWAARQLVQEPVAGVFVQGLEFSMLPSDPNKKCNKHNLKYAECRLMHAKWEMTELLERSEGFIAGWFADTVDAARKMRTLLKDAPTLESANLISQEGMFNGACFKYFTECEFAGACTTGRQAHLIEANYPYNPWSPFKE